MKSKIIVFALVSSLLYAENEVYVVKSGDSLRNIAKAHNIKLETLINLNNLKNPNLIYPGMKLKIAKKENKSNLFKIVYKVRKGDTLEKIAKEHKVKVKDIVKLNQIENSNLIFPGMELIIREENLSLTYEEIGDKLLKNVDYSLKQRIERALSYYNTSKKFLIPNDISTFERIDKKISGLENFKEALEFENKALISSLYADEENTKKYYTLALKALLKAEKSELYLATISEKIENLKKILNILDGVTTSNH